MDKVNVSQSPIVKKRRRIDMAVKKKAKPKAKKAVKKAKKKVAAKKASKKRC